MSLTQIWHSEIIFKKAGNLLSLALLKEKVPWIVSMTYDKHDIDLKEQITKIKWLATYWWGPSNHNISYNRCLKYNAKENKNFLCKKNTPRKNPTLIENI